MINLSHYFLLSNLSREMHDTAELPKFYNGRQTIEAFNKGIGGDYCSCAIYGQVALS